MLFLIAFGIFGVVGGFMVNSFMEGRSSLGSVLTIGLGIAGSFILGILLLIFGKALVGDGPDFLVALLASVVGAIILPLIVTIAKK